MITSTFSDRWLATLGALGVPGDVHLVSSRTMDGISHHASAAPLTPADDVPMWLLKLAAADYLDMRVSPLSVSGRVGALWVRWTPAWVRGANGEKQPSPAAVLAIRDALRMMPRPSALIDAGGEWIAIWQLATPVDPEIAHPALEQLAAALGGQAPGNLADVDLPVCGLVRNWDTHFVRRVAILETSGGTHTMQSVVPTRTHTPKGKKS